MLQVWPISDVSIMFCNLFVYTLSSALCTTISKYILYLVGKTSPHHSIPFSKQSELFYQVRLLKLGSIPKENYVRNVPHFTKNDIKLLN